MFRCVKTEKGFVITLGPKEVELFQFLGRELRRLLEHGDPAQSLLRPFHPSRRRHETPDAVHAELDGAMDEELLRFRLERVEAVQRELLPRDRSHGPLRLLLDEARLDTWLAYLTDLRLLVGTVIGFSPDNPLPYPEDDPETWTREIHIYHFLSAVQEHLLELLGLE